MKNDTNQCCHTNHLPQQRNLSKAARGLNSFCTHTHLTEKTLQVAHHYSDDSVKCASHNPTNASGIERKGIFLHDKWFSEAVRGTVSHLQNHKSIPFVTCTVYHGGAVKVRIGDGLRSAGVLCCGFINRKHPPPARHPHRRAESAKAGKEGTARNQFLTVQDSNTLFMNRQWERKRKRMLYVVGIGVPARRYHYCSAATRAWLHSKGAWLLCRVVCWE